VGVVLGRGRGRMAHDFGQQFQASAVHHPLCRWTCRASGWNGAGWPPGWVGLPCKPVKSTDENSKRKKMSLHERALRRRRGHGRSEPSSRLLSTSTQSDSTALLPRRHTGCSSTD